MDDAQYRQEINNLKLLFSEAASGKNVGIIVPAAMEMVLSAIMHVKDADKEQALRATQSLHPMIDYIEGQIRGHQ